MTSNKRQRHGPRCRAWTAHIALAAACALGAAQNVGALSIVEQKRVGNDVAEMLFVAEMQSSGRRGATADADAAIDWALSYGAAYPNVHMAASNAHAAQRYDSRSGRRTWFARRELRLESKDTERLALLAGTLLARLKLSRARFKLSEQLRRATELRLMGSAMKRFAREKPAADARPDSIEVTVDNLARAETPRLEALLTSNKPAAEQIRPGHSVIRITLRTADAPR